MSRERFELALEQLKPQSWAFFEELSSDFLAADFDALRTVATPTGDEGRDATLFSPEGEDTVLIQYSVASDWRSKINATLRRISVKHPQASVLIYMSNQLIGAGGDDLKKTVRQKYKLQLDIRDRSWFVERRASNRQREVSAERLAERIVDPFLKSKKVISSKALSLTAPEEQAAFVYLTLQFENEEQTRGLTKLCFEALVRSVLRHTHQSNRLGRAAIHSGILSLLPNHDKGLVVQQVDSALLRLNKRFIRHHTNVDEFCLTHQEILRLAAQLALRESAERAFDQELRTMIAEHLSGSGATVTILDDVAVRTRRILDRFLHGRGTQFVSAIRTGKMPQPDLEEIRRLVLEDISAQKPKGHVPAVIDTVTAVVEDVLEQPGPATQSYLKPIAESHTLYAFLLETPDVQAAVTKIFAEGDIWLDTSLVLPLIAEDLIEEEHRLYTHLLRAARDAGLKLFVTYGVLEELESHTRRCITCSQADFKRWKGNVPFLYSIYLLTGAKPQAFMNWLESFRGTERPQDDIAEFLAEEFGIQVAALEPELTVVPEDLRLAVQGIWQRAHERRRAQYKTDIDDLTIIRLTAHDVENYVGVLAKRTREREAPLGFTSWWLTLDRTAYSLAEELEKWIHPPYPSNPVLSPDFLVNYLSLSPARSSSRKVPFALAHFSTDVIPGEFLEIVEEVHSQMDTLKPRVLRRKLRDRLEAAKQRLGPIAEGGTAASERRLNSAARQTRRR